MRGDDFMKGGGEFGYPSKDRTTPNPLLDICIWHTGECGQLTTMRILKGNTLEEPVVMIIFPLKHTPPIKILKTY